VIFRSLLTSYHASPTSARRDTDASSNSYLIPPVPSISIPPIFDMATCRPLRTAERVSKLLTCHGCFMLAACNTTILGDESCSCISFTQSTPTFDEAGSVTREVRYHSKHRWAWKGPVSGGNSQPDSTTGQAAKFLWKDIFQCVLITIWHPAFEGAGRMRGFLKPKQPSHPT